ncbi:helix-turn-helix domain-containing protein [Xanthovirga aplysinae]|uniref:helix-turn-helix domain-containing protein n=1 Tax=Xanthovirga aplysinae TaxID=2529853 RepID=UPI0012BC96EB|nr:helix-turn-helix transcriptional regulator [Xanthovirga aplysinae]MTI30204.1 XRE family transcriptional regulator [Xanthovirga aplysinae]
MSLLGGRLTKSFHLPIEILPSIGFFYDYNVKVILHFCIFKPNLSFRFCFKKVSNVKIGVYLLMSNLLALFLHIFDKKMDIGKKITILRKRKSLSQEELADAAGVSRASIHNYEALKTEPRPEILRKIVKILGTTLDGFYDLDEESLEKEAADLGDTIMEIYRQKVANQENIIESLQDNIRLLRKEIELQQIEIDKLKANQPTQERPKKKRSFW